jgi:hypothetical protein
MVVAMVAMVAVVVVAVVVVAVAVVAVVVVAMVAVVAVVVVAVAVFRIAPHLRAVHLSAYKAELNQTGTLAEHLPHWNIPFAKLSFHPDAVHLIGQLPEDQFDKCLY